MNKEQWKSGVADELAFWSNWLTTQGGNWPGDYKFRIDPNSEIQNHIARHLDIFPEGELKILDVGAGPMTSLGKNYKKYVLSITPVDALAVAYSSLPFPEGLPLLQTKFCESELLTSEFSENSFDVTYARNTLDHSYDPARAIEEMITVTKPGGLIITEHSANEALNENWQGFHQWNFYIENGEFFISNKEEKASLTKRLHAKVKTLEIAPDHSQFVFHVMQKLA